MKKITLLLCFCVSVVNVFAQKETFIVSGTVTNADSSPAVGLTIIAYDKDITSEQPLGEATTDANGDYVIRYSEAEFLVTKSERGAANLFVRVFSIKQELLSTSKTIRNAPTALTLNVMLPADVQVENSQQLSGTNTDNTAIIGSWGKSNSVSQLDNNSYNKQQYTFYSNGSYSFTGKTYSEQYDETLLIKESGTYLINGNNLTINPQNSVIEAWSKKNGGDNWNQLKTSQKRTLEKTTYQFTIVERNLVLQVEKETVRDGRFSNKNSYTYGPPGTFTAIKLPGE